MAKLNPQLVRQVGEHSVTAELGRRGIIATPFAGNVPDIDILAYKDGASIPIQVKAVDGSKNSDWQFDASKYIEISFEGENQVVGDLKPLANSDLIFAFVRVSHDADEIFILTQATMQRIMKDHYVANIDRLGGRRPRNWKSTHCALRVPDLEPYRDNWELIDGQLSVASPQSEETTPTRKRTIADTSNISAGVADSWLDAEIAAKRSKRWACVVDGEIYGSVPEACTSLQYLTEVRNRIIGWRGKLVAAAEKGEALTDELEREWRVFERTGNSDWKDAA